MNNDVLYNVQKSVSHCFCQMLTLDNTPIQSVINATSKYWLKHLPIQPTDPKSNTIMLKNISQLIWNILETQYYEWFFTPNHKDDEVINRFLVNIYKELAAHNRSIIGNNPELIYTEPSSVITTFI